MTLRREPKFKSGMTDTCVKCGILFITTPSKWSSFNHQCNPCSSVYRNAWRGANRQSVRVNRRRWYKANKEKMKKFQQRYRQIHSVRPKKVSIEAQRARSLVLEAMRSGGLKKPKTCERCSQKGIVEAHHEDYAKPLVVEWLCCSCHGETRWAENREIGPRRKRG
ncbi:hypothetical protein LCGC14_2955590 [marine sediment metagenome]|uniref:Uncharacterized protein n=1 Tax=marine sediment metagenome TaxID=412755 RepID=A0A0F8ZLJ6_9ZZZZ